MAEHKPSKSFMKCHPVTAGWEGGWSNHKDDPGKQTMYGVIQRVYDTYRDAKGLKRQSVRLITKDEALDIFYNNYWLKAGCNSLFEGVDLAVYDASVNSGVSRGRKWLLASLGSADHSVTVKRICAKRLGFVQSLKIWKSFGRGWARRIADVQATGVAWALAAMHDAPAAKQHLEDEADVQKKKAATKTKAGGAGGVVTGAGGGDVALNPAHAEQVAGWALSAIFIGAALIVGVVLWRAWINNQQAAAFDRAAKEIVP